MSSIAFVFPIAITLGFFLGKWIGGWFGRPILGQWLGLGWGIASAFWELFKTSQRLNRPTPPPKDS
ncbi:MAG: AtpZ/AtpI family protein [Holophagaceae bacterium]